MGPITAGGGHIGDVQDHLAVLVGGHADLEAVEQVRTALASVPHLWIGDADDAVRGSPLSYLGLALVVDDQVVTQDLGQEPAQIADLIVVDLFGGQIQDCLCILE